MVVGRSIINYFFLYMQLCLGAFNTTDMEETGENKTSEIDHTTQSIEPVKPETSVVPSIDNKKTSSTSEEPIVNLLGDDIEFTPYVQASKDVDFGQFQEAVSPISPVQSTQSSSSMTFDPFTSFETSTNLFQPTSFPFNQQQSFINSSVFQQQSNITSSNNIWSSAAGKLDISLNNLIPYTRGNQQKTTLTLNQLTSPTDSNKSDFSLLNTNTQSKFSTLNKK
ncbi:unnamed protein product [Rotaria sp. Silwood1]|nr:unnamed protein product [Rotaria sp. Silwood1]